MAASAPKGAEAGAPDSVLIECFRKALKAADPSAVVDEPFSDTTSVIDGCFDWIAVARSFKREAQAAGFAVVAASNAEKT